MTYWVSFSTGIYPDINTVIEIMEKGNLNSIQTVFYGFEENRIDKSIPNIVKSGKVGLKILWRKKEYNKEGELK